MKCYNKIVTVMANETKEVGNMTQNYTPEFRKKIVRLHEEECGETTYLRIPGKGGYVGETLCKPDKSPERA